MCSCFLFATQAAPKDWQFIPSTCVVHKTGDVCRLEISIQRLDENGVIPANTCVTLAEVELHCTREAVQEIVLPISLSETSEVRLITPDGEEIIKTINVQTLKPLKKRRRVRNPWSLF